jgi:hypothetical protein
VAFCSDPSSHPILNPCPRNEDTARNRKPTEQASDRRNRQLVSHSCSGSRAAVKPGSPDHSRSMAERGKDNMAKCDMLSALRKFATPPSKATPRWPPPVTRNWLHNTLAGSRAPHANSSEGPREAGLQYRPNIYEAWVTWHLLALEGCLGGRADPKPPRHGCCTQIPPR